MNIKQLVKVEFDLSNQQDVQKFNQFQKMDDIVKANIEFNKFLDEEIERVADDGVAPSWIKENYIKVHKQHGVEV